MSLKTLPKTDFDKVLDVAIKTGVVAWMIKVVFRANRV